MNSMRRVLAAALALVLALGLAGCNLNDTTWVYAYDGEQMPAGVYISFLLDAFTEARNGLLEAEDARAEAERESLGEDETYEYDYETFFDIYYGTPKELLTMELDGVAVSQWIENEARSYALQYYAARALYAEHGLEMDQQTLASISSLASQMVESKADHYQQNGIAQSSLYKQLETEEMKQQLFDLLYDNGGEYAMAESELRDEVLDRHTKVQYLTFDKATAEDEDAAALDEAAKTRADYALQRLADGSDTIESIYFEYAFEDAMSSGDGGTLYQPMEGELDYIVTKGYSYSLYESQINGNYVTFSEVISEGAFTLPVGVPTLLEDDSAYYVVTRLDLEAGREYEGLRRGVLTELMYDEFTEMLEAYGAGLGLTKNQAALKRYSYKFPTYPENNDSF